MIAYNANRMARCCIEDALRYSRSLRVRNVLMPLLLSYASTRMVFNQTLLSQPVIRFKFAHMARVSAESACQTYSARYNISSGRRESASLDRIAHLPARTSKVSHL